jgi:membrane-bound ClpP family serine protease
MALTTIILILAFGLFLIVVELFFVPGTTFVGIVGALFLLYGIFLSYRDLEVLPATVVLVLSIFITGVVTKVGFKRLANSQFTVKEQIDSRVNEEDYSFLEVGDEGVALSDLRPEGYAMIKDQKIVVHSKGEFISNKSPLEVIRIRDNKVIVKSKSV